MVFVKMLFSMSTLCNDRTGQSYCLIVSWSVPCLLCFEFSDFSSL